MAFKTSVFDGGVEGDGGILTSGSRGVGRREIGIIEVQVKGAYM